MVLRLQIRCERGLVHLVYCLHRRLGIHRLKNYILVVVSLCASVLFAEMLARLIFPPVDYLGVELVYDPVLNHRILPGDNGHDEWGNRSPHGPEKSDILAIGDSMTYGYGVQSHETWPSQLRELTGLKVYNAGVGGYGPIQYFEVLKTRYDDISPELVLVMLYIGNDLFDAFNVVYGRDHWSHLRGDDTLSKDQTNSFEIPGNEESKLKQFRRWLSKNSVIYRITSQSNFFDSIRRSEKQTEDPNAISLDHNGTKSILQPAIWEHRTDPESSRIIEGKRLTYNALLGMADFLDEKGTSFHVVLMPLRDHVLLNSNEDPNLQSNEAVRNIAADIELAERELIQIFTERGIGYTNLRPAFEHAAMTGNPFPPTDSHPNAMGYGVVANELLPIVQSLGASD